MTENAARHITLRCGKHYPVRPIFAASRKAWVMACALAVPVPTMSNAVPCAGVVIGAGSPALHRDAALEPQQLDRDLALVVIHGDDGVQQAVAGLQEDGVGGEGAPGWAIFPRSVPAPPVR